MEIWDHRGDYGQSRSSLDFVTARKVVPDEGIELSGGACGSPAISMACGVWRRAGGANGVAGGVAVFSGIR